MHDFIPNPEQNSNDDYQYENSEHSNDSSMDSSMDDIEESYSNYKYVYRDEESESEYEEEGFENIKPHRIRIRRDSGLDYELTEEEFDVLREVSEYSDSEFETYSSSSEVDYHYEPEWEID